MASQESLEQVARIDYLSDRTKKEGTSESSGTPCIDFPLPEEIGDGYRRQVAVGKDLGYGLLCISEARQSYSLVVDAPGNWVKLTTHLSAETTRFGVADETGIIPVSRYDGYILSPDTHGIIHIERDNSLQEFCLFVSDEFLGRFFDHSKIRCRRDVASLIRSSPSHLSCLKSNPGPATRLAISQLLNPPALSEPLLALYREAKLLEILSLRIGELEQEGMEGETRIPLSPVDRKHLEEARDILTAEADAPPSIRELARRVGLNTTKLKTGFRIVFGLTPYEAVRDASLAKALQLLQRGTHNVSQAALVAGYSSLSSFSRAFYRRYGILPRDARKKSS